MPDIEALTILAVVEAQDKASQLLEGIFGSLDRVAGAFADAGAAAEASGAAVDQGLLFGETAVERLSFAEEQLVMAQEMAADSAMALGTAQREAAAAYAAANDGAAILAMANEELRLAQLNNSIAGKELRDTQAALADADGILADALRGHLVVAQDEATAAAERLTAAQKQVAVSIETYGASNRAAAAAARDLKVAQDENAVSASALKETQGALGIAQDEVNAHSNAMKEAMGGVSSAMLGVGGATAIAAGYSVKMAGDFQQQTQTLVSGAGVQQNQIDGVRQSIEQMAVSTGTSTKDLSDSFFAVNSRLGDVAQSTTVVNDAAEIAKVHMADLNTVSVALASSLNAYAGTGLTAGQAANILGVAVEKGGMSFQELSGSLSTVLPKAKEAGLSFAQVTAAVATMTQSGQSAQQATQDLAHVIGKLQSPTAQMVSTWNQMGLTQKQVSDTLHGPGGLNAAMQLIADTAKSKLGPSGQVVVSSFKESADASNALGQMLKSMNPDAAKLAQALQGGTISVKDYTKAEKELTGASSDQAAQYLSLFNKANGFNDAVKAGQPGFSDFSALMKSAYGDATSMQAALLLGGTAANKWTDATNAANQAAKDSKSGIEGWSSVQETMNQKLSQAKEAIQVAGISLGTALLPAVTKIIQDITPWIEKMGEIIQKHQEATKILVAVGLSLGAIAVSLKIVVGAYNLLKDTVTVIKGVKTAVTELELGTKLVSAATKIWSGIQAAFNAIMALNPIMLVVIAIGLLVAAAIYAFYHFKGFHDFIMASWAVIKTAAVDLWHMMEAAWKGISAGAKAVWDFLVGVFDGIVDAVTSFGSAVWKDIVSVWDGIKAFFEKWWPLLLVIFAAPIAVLMAIWNHFHTQITEVATTVWNAIKAFLSGTWDVLKTIAQYAWLYIKDMIIDPIMDVWHSLESVWGYISSFLSGAWNWLKGVANDAWQGIKNYIIQPAQEVLNWLDGFASGIMNKISGAFNGVLNWLGGVGSWFVSVGEDVVNGIISGVTNAGGALMNKIKGLANDALSAAKSFLGIGSPSKEFANQVGQWIPHGVAQGVQDHTQTAIQAVQTMAGQLPKAIGVNGAVNLGLNGLNAAGTITATGIGLGLNTGGGGGGDLHVHVDLTNAVVAGDNGINDLVNKMGTAIATKILPQAGVKLRRY